MSSGFNSMGFDSMGHNNLSATESSQLLPQSDCHGDSGLPGQDQQSQEFYISASYSLPLRHPQQGYTFASGSSSATKEIASYCFSNHQSNILEDEAHFSSLHTPSSETHELHRCSTSMSGEIEVNIEDLIELRNSHSNASSDSNQTLTPAQRRRKAQNRAAQRALRDRKRQRVQELEEQVSDLSVNNTRLKQQLTLVQAENHFLKTGGLSGVLPVDDSMFQAMLLQGGSLCPRGQNNDFNQEGPRYRDPNGPVQPLWQVRGVDFSEAANNLVSLPQGQNNVPTQSMWPTELVGTMNEQQQTNAWSGRPNSTGHMYADLEPQQHSPWSTFNNEMVEVTMPDGVPNIIKSTTELLTHRDQTQQHQNGWGSSRSNHQSPTCTQVVSQGWQVTHVPGTRVKH